MIVMVWLIFAFVVFVIEAIWHKVLTCVGLAFLTLALLWPLMVTATH